MPGPDDRRLNELVLAPFEYAFVQDKTKGEIATYVGPTTITLSANDCPMMFDAKTKCFVEVDVSRVKRGFVTAPAGWYILLLNPVVGDKHPKSGGKSSTPDELEIGKKVVIPGPASFPLWPGQMAEVIKGHRLRSNEFIIIEIYDAEAAKKTWTKATVETTTAEIKTAVDPSLESTEADEASKGKKGDQKAADKKPEMKVSFFSKVPDDIANGKRYVINGTDVAFYIPPSGVKVVKDDKNNAYVRQAVSLEKLEYAILLDENGEKTYERGPKVVFPTPTQTFVSRDGTIKFRAYELDARKGIYVKVIEEYVDGDVTHKVGEELFITGDGIIYFPRREHSIVRYGDQEMHYAIAIPKGEARYVLDRGLGKINLVTGEKMFLPDPRKEVVTRRVLSDHECLLLYPGNDEVLRINRALATEYLDPARTERPMVSRPEVKPRGVMAMYGSSTLAGDFANEDQSPFPGDAFERNTDFTKPRTVVLDTKYQGAVTVNIWTGFAVKIVNKDPKGQSRSRVVQGPATIHLEYDEMLEMLSLSTGKPKTTDRLYETVFLRVIGNKVSDYIDCVTRDLVNVKLRLSYQVNFEGDSSKWFDLDNYVKHMCDHARSVVKGAVKNVDISVLNERYVDIIRDAVLGAKPADGKRSGMRFAENNMRVYDVDVLGIEFDQNVKQLLEKAQFQNLEGSLMVARREHEVAEVKKFEALKREELKSEQETAALQHDLRMSKLSDDTAFRVAEAVDRRAAEEASRQHAMKLIEIEQTSRDELEQRKLKAEADQLALAEANAAKRREIKRLDAEIELAIEKARQELELANQQAAVDAANSVAQAFDPQLVLALNTLRDTEVLKTLSAHFTDLSILEGQSVLATAQRFLGVIPESLRPVFEKLLTSESKELES